MASGLTRALATLLLVAFAFVVWKHFLQPPAPAHKAAGNTAASARASSARTTKKKPKKRAAKKPSAPVDAAPSPAAGTSSLATPAAVPAIPPSANDDGAAVSDSDSDSDEGLSAAQILARRKFATTRAIGGGASKSRSAQPSGPRFELDQRVLARFQGGSEWFPATVCEVRRGNVYHVKYDDGELEHSVPAALIKAMDRESEAAAAAAASSGSDSAPPERAAGVLSTSDESDEDDGWSIVGAAGSKRSKAAAPNAAAAAAPVSGDGLTKRQRESRRKRERQREVKELARAQAQENGLHARWGGTYSKMKYVPPPPQS